LYSFLPVLERENEREPIDGAKAPSYRKIFPLGIIKIHIPDRWVLTYFSVFLPAKSPD